LRIAQDRVPLPIDLTELPEYPVCELEHGVLAKRYAAAKKELVAVMGNPSVHLEPDGEHRVSWHYGSVVHSDGSVEPLIRIAHLHTDKGELADSENKGAVSVSTIPARESRRTSRFVVSAENGPDLGTRDIWYRDLYVAPLPKVADALVQHVQYDAWTDGAQQWAEGFMALPEPVGQPLNTDYWFTAAQIPHDVGKLLVNDFQDASEVAQALAFGFNPARRDDIRAMLALHTDEVIQNLQRYSLVDRYGWLLEHAEAIQTDIAEAERTVVTDTFRAAYTAWHAKKEAQIDGLAVLVDELRRMPAVTSGGVVHYVPPVRPGVAARIGSVRDHIHRRIDGMWA
jgi:hypothetical protein